MKSIREDITMSDLQIYLSKLLNEKLYQMIISNPVKKDAVNKIKIRPILMKGVLMFQETRFCGTQVFHQNFCSEEMQTRIVTYMEQDFKQLEAEHMEGNLHVLISKKGKVTLKYQKKQGTNEAVRPVMTHNREKKYILKEGIPVPFLIDLGVQTPEGKIVRSRYDKFKQINRYLEFVEDILPTLTKKDTIHIVDFGCGKSYLTFALYYYLHELQKQDVSITGLDLKEDVIQKCNALAKNYGYEKLHFYHGDIADFQGSNDIDMVVTLHACDTATDYALKKAIDWNAKVIFSVPCCQHEVNKQIENELLSPILKYGILKERLSAILTDGIRANLLEEAGYETQILEFIDMEHTPKNLLIRGVNHSDLRTGQQAVGNTLEKLTQEMHIDTTLQKLMKDSKAMWSEE